MTIIRDGQWVELGLFQDALARAARSVVRVRQFWWPSSEEQPAAERRQELVSTGFYLTPDLVITPDDGPDRQMSRSLVIDGQPATVVARLSTPPDAPRSFAVVRAAGPSDHDSVHLLLEKPLSAALWIVHYPRTSWTANVSFGTIIDSKDGILDHDASTFGGSSGAPLFDLFGRVMGIHFWGGPNLNRAWSIASVIEALRSTPVWPEIAAQHQIAGVPNAPPRPMPKLSAEVALRLALAFRFNPDALSPHDRSAVEPLVADPSAKNAWTLRSSDRRRILMAAGSLEALRQGQPNLGMQDAGQAVIDRILKGPPFDLSAEPFESLPYFLQAVRWFEGLVPDLPSANDVQRAQQRRDIRARLEALVGKDFKGRDDEIARLNGWMARADAGPIVLSGVGGVGKSALLAAFAKGRPQDTLLLWLDFDRADIAPDHADSILLALADQATAQRDGIAWSAGQGGDWEASAEALGKAIANRLGNASPPLLVLDSFEIAQYKERYQELWPVIEHLLGTIPNLHVIVTGRAPVTSLTLAGRPAESMVLSGLRRDIADQYLLDHGVADKEARARVLDLARGIPLILVLAVALNKAGGDLLSIPAVLEQRLTEGYFYDRILDRFADSELKPVARGAVVLRRVTPEVIEKVLGGLLPTGVSAVDAFARLGHELAFVEGSDALRVRAEVRGPTLQLLQRDDEPFVRGIEEAAVAYYTGMPLDDGAAAELVYHHLRLGDEMRAASVFRWGCVPFLRGAEDDLEGPAREWLLARVQPGPAATRAWEADAVDRIRAALARGLTRPVPSILAERADRSDDSPLVFYDAWVAGELNGDTSAALAALGAPIPPSEPVYCYRAVLRAYLTAKSDLEKTDAILAEIVAANLLESGLPEVEVRAACHAARIRLTFLPDKERAVLSMFNQGSDAERQQRIAAALSDTDVLDARLRDVARLSLDAVSSQPIEFTSTDAQSALRFTGSRDSQLRKIIEDAAHNHLSSEEVARTAGLPREVAELALAAYRRWELLTHPQAVDWIYRWARASKPWTRLVASLATTLVALHESPTWPFLPLVNSKTSRQLLNEHLGALIDAPFAHAVGTARWSPGQPSSEWDPEQFLTELLVGTSKERDVQAALDKLDDYERYALHLAAANLLPNTLELLVRYLAGLSDQAL